MNRGNLIPGWNAALVGAAVLLLVAGASCGHRASPPQLSPSPTPAASLTALPSGLGADRYVQLYLRDSLSPSQREELAAEIAALPEVEAYHFVSRAEAAEAFKEYYGVDKAPPLPASFRLLVRRGPDCQLTVCAHFFEDPRLQGPWQVPVRAPASD